MKKPYLNLEQRESIRFNTRSADYYMLELRWLQLCREIYRKLIIPIYDILIKYLKL